MEFKGLVCEIAKEEKLRFIAIAKILRNCLVDTDKD